MRGSWVGAGGGRGGGAGVVVRKGRLDATECRAALKGYLASSPSMNRLKNMSE